MEKNTEQNPNRNTTESPRTEPRALNDCRFLNECRITFPSLSANEGYARACAAAFCAQLDPTATEISDIKCAVSEAVTNAIVHGSQSSLPGRAAAAGS